MGVSRADRLPEDPGREHRPVRLGHRRAGSARAALQRAHPLPVRADPERRGRRRDRAGLRALRRPAGGAARRPAVHRGGRPRRLRGRPEREVRRPHPDREVRHRVQVGIRLHQDAARLQRGRALQDRELRPAVSGAAAGRGGHRDPVRLPLRSRHRLPRGLRAGDIVGPERPGARHRAVPDEHRTPAGPRRRGRGRGHRARVGDRVRERPGGASPGAAVKGPGPAGGVAGLGSSGRGPGRPAGPDRDRLPGRGGPDRRVRPLPADGVLPHREGDLSRFPDPGPVPDDARAGQHS